MKGIYLSLSSFFNGNFTKKHHPPGFSPGNFLQKQQPALIYSTIPIHSIIPFQQINKHTMQQFTGTKTQVNKSKSTFIQFSQMFKWAFVLLIFFAGALVSNNAKAQFSQVPVTGFTADVVAEGTTNVDATPTTTDPVDGSGGGANFVFVTSTFRPSGAGAACSSAGFPSVITSSNTTTNTGIAYSLQSPTGPNSLRVTSTTPLDLSLVTPTNASTLYVVCLGGNGAVTFTAKINFSDLTSETVTTTAPDWCAASPATNKLPNATTPTQFYRIARTSTTCNGALCQYMYEMPLVISPSNYQKTITSITFTNTGVATAFLHILAVGKKAPCTIPADAATGLTQGVTTTSSIQASWTAAPSTPSGYLVVGYPTGSAVTAPADGTTYIANQALGLGKVIQSGATTSATASGLTGGTTYDVYVYSFNSGASCGGPVYNTVNVLSGSLSTTACSGVAGGTYSVGPTGTYTNLTAALTAIGAGITGPVILELQAGYTSGGETFPITFPVNPCIGAINTLTIRPETGAANLAITSANTTGTINFNGSNYITIDGRAGGVGVSQLSIANTNAGASYAINFTGDASNNTVKYCTVTSRNTSATSGTITFGGGTISGNDNNTIDNCSIKDDGTGNPANGIYSAGTSAAIDNSGNTISNNLISNYFSAGSVSSGILLTSTGNSGWTITNNRLFQTATRVFSTGNTHNGISVQSGSGYTITGNTIGFANSAGTGTTNLLGNTTAVTGTFPSAYTVTTTNANTTRYIAINCAFAAGGANSLIQSNTIGGFALYSSSGASTTNGIWCGINLTAGNATIGGATAGLGNTIGATSGQGSVYTICSTSGGTAVGIYTTTINTVTVQNNTIGAIDAVGTSASVTGGFAGIDAAGTGGVITQSNNTIGNTTVDNIRTGYTLSGANLSNAGTLTLSTGVTSALIGIRSTATGNGYTASNNVLRGWATSGTVSSVTGIISSGTMTGTGAVTVNNNALGTSGLGWIRYAVATTSGSLTGISVANTVSTLHSIQTNDFQGIVHSAAGVTSHTYINFTGGTAAGNVASVNGNTFTNLSVNTTGAVLFFSHNYVESATSTLNFNNNSIVTGYARTSAGTVTLSLSNSTSASGSILNLTGNNFSNIALTGASAMLGFSNTDGGVGTIKTITGNTFNNWTGTTSSITAINVTYINGVSSISNNNITNLAGQAAITGINIGNVQNVGNPLNVSSNTITGLVSTGTGGAVTGITCSNTSTVININNNTINTLSTTAGSPVIGIGVTAATATNVFKNTVCNLSGSAAASTVNGILVSAGTTVTVYNNRIGDLRTPAANAANPLIGINITGGTTVRAYYNTVYLNGTSSGALFGSSAISVSTTPTVTLNNNIFYNASSVTGAGLAAAYRRSNATLTTYAAASNNNLFFGSTIYTDGTNTDATLGAYKSRVSLRDNVSVSENLTSAPTFLSVTCGDPNFLKISTAIATQLESAGTPIAGITDDFEGDTRNASLPDIGADEFAGIVSDATAPSISAIALVGTACSLTSRNVTALITDATGVDNNLSKPRIYYRKNGGSYVSSEGSLTSGTVNAGTWTFTIDYSLVSGAAPTNVIDYFVVAQDQLGNVTGSPLAGLAVTNVNTVTTPPTTPLTYTIVNTLSGTYTVGSGGNYATITAAIADYNSACLTGPVVFSLTDASYTEAAAMTINANANASAVNTLTIKPTQAATNIAVTGGSTSAIFILNGADYVTLDGSTAATVNTVCPASSASRNLTITNSNAGTSSAVVWLQTTASTDAATNNNIINCNLVGSGVTQTLFGAGSGSATISTTSLGTANNNNSFVNNNISGVQYGIYSQGASAANKNTGTVINQNLINTSANTRGGIWVGFDNGVIISGNTISNIALAGTTDVFGITCGFGTSLSSTTSAGNEVINATITKNIIGSVVNSGLFSAYGIGVSAATIGTTLIADNMVYGISSNGSGGDIGAGIVSGGGVGSTTNVYYNTVAMQGTIAGASAATQTSTCFAVTNSTAPTLDLRNNIFSNTQLGNAGATVRFAAIALGYSTYTSLTSNNNNLYVAGAGPGTYTVGITGTVVAGTNSVSLANWQTTTGKDAASVSVLPNYISTTNLRLSTLNNDPMDNTGSVVSVTDDIDCTVRSATPDMGINEFTKVPTVVINSVAAAPPTTQCVATARTITANISSGNFTITSVTLNYSFNGVTQAPIRMTGGNPAANQTSDWTAAIPAATPLMLLFHGQLLQWMPHRLPKLQPERTIQMFL